MYQHDEADLHLMGLMYLKNLMKKGDASDGEGRGDAVIAFVLASWVPI
jgi:hypothetical protein